MLLIRAVFYCIPWRSNRKSANTISPAQDSRFVDWLLSINFTRNQIVSINFEFTVPTSHRKRSFNTSWCFYSHTVYDFGQGLWITRNWYRRDTIVLPGLYKGIHFVVLESTNCPLMKFCTFGVLLPFWELSAAILVNLITALNSAIFDGLIRRIMVKLV